MSEGKCFAVVSGSYSDYSVLCVFERRNDAVTYAAAQNGLTFDKHSRLEELWAKDPKSEEEREEWRALCDQVRVEMRYVEEFDFYPAGVVPVKERV